eukprot:scaffold10578_cov158-Skeletonema_menzelii.AAC.6
MDTTTNAIVEEEAVASSSNNTPAAAASPLDEMTTEPSSQHQESRSHHHSPAVDTSSSNSSSSSHDIGLNLSSFDMEAYNSLNGELHHLVVTSSSDKGGGTIASAERRMDDNDDDGGNINDDKNNNTIDIASDKVPLLLSNSDGLPSIPTDASNCNIDDDDNGTANDDIRQEVPDDGENQQIQQQQQQHQQQQQQPSSTLSKEEQLEHRILHLEQSLQQLSQFCQTILQNQQQQSNHSSRGGVGARASPEEYDTIPSTPPTEEEEEEETNSNNNQWHPSTTQYAPLDSPDASLNNGHSSSRRSSTLIDSSLLEERSNLQQNSLSVKLGVTPYNNNNNNNINNNNNRERRGRESLDSQKKTMSMLFLDIEPGQSRGPNLITLDAVAAASDDDEEDVVVGGDDIGGDRRSNDSSSGSNGNCSGSGEEGSVSNSHNETKEGGRKIDDVASPSSSPILRRQTSHSSPSLRTVLEKSPVAIEDEGKVAKARESPPLPSSKVLSTRRDSGLSSSLKINALIKTEESLECQAYTPSHLEALRLRREVGKGRAYSLNDAVISPPRSSNSRKGGDNLQQLKLPTISSPVWKPSFEALNTKDGEGGEKPLLMTGITADTSSGNDASSSGGKDISANIPQLIMPDLNVTNDETIEEGGVIVVNVPTMRKESCGSASSAGNNSKSLPPSTSCASNMSSDSTKTPKSGNMKREVRTNSFASSKERSQSVSSSKSKDSGSGVSAVATANPADSTLNNEVLTSNKKVEKSESKTSSQQHQSDSGKNKTMSQYVINDLLNIDSRNHDGSATEDVDANMEEFLRIPSKFEYLMVFSLAVCVDSFLYPWAMLPLKFIWGLVCLACTIYKMIQKKKWKLNPDEADVHGIGFHRRHLYAILQSLLIWLVYSQILCPISIGKLYHWIRGQAMLKLYVLIAIVEVFDRLLCSFGQDAWDSLYWNTTRRPRHPRLFVSIIVVGVYVIIHSLFLFVHVATLSVAVNSADNALLTLLISGNFAEIKSTVFKKYNKQNLFKITTSDICERFKLALFLLLILFLNRFQGEMTSSMVNDYYFMCAIVFGAELVSDWIKHSFITKFNFIKSTAYFDYALVLSGDVTGIGHEGLSLDYTHAAVKRLGLAQIPLVCVTARYLHEAVRFAIAFKGNGDVDHPFAALVDLMADGSKWKFYIGLLKCMGVLVVFKVFLGICIRAVARRNLGGDSRVALKDKGLTSKAPKVKDNKETTETKKKQ